LGDEAFLQFMEVQTAIDRGGINTTPTPKKVAPRAKSATPKRKPATKKPSPARKARKGTRK